MKAKASVAWRTSAVLACALWLLVPACSSAPSETPAAPTSIRTPETGVALTTQQPNTWVKRSVGPRLGYEAAMVWDTWRHQIMRLKPHNLNGGCQQNELWVYDPAADRWTLRGPDREPPGNCRQPQHVFDPENGRYIRFTATGGDHGWQWEREVNANESSVWNYDPDANRWHNMRPLPEPNVGPQRAAAWDSDNGVIVVFGGVRGSPTSVYDPHTNTWHEMHPANEPPKVTGCYFCYDPGTKRFILFGSEKTPLVGTWAYDLAKNSWSELPVPLSPPVECIGGNEAVSVYDPLHRVVLTVVIVREEGEREPGPSYTTPRHLETWALDPSKNAWTKMNPAGEPDPGGTRCRVMTFAPELNLAFFDVVEYKPSDGGKEHEQQLWIYRYAAGEAVLAPEHLRVTVKNDGSAALVWSPPTGGTPPAQYVIYRGTGADVPWKARYAKITSVAGTVYADKGLETGAQYFYRVRALDAKGQESAGSATGRAQPPVVEDVVASVVSAEEVRLAWLSPPEGGEIAGYIIERAPATAASDGPHNFGACTGLGAFTRLTPKPIQALHFTDLAVDLQKRMPVQVESRTKPYRKAPPDDTGDYAFALYAYRVRAVNALGLESGPSPYILTVPPQVRFLQSRMEGEAAHLKWEAAPGPGIKGYRVWRLNGAANKVIAPVLLTENPIVATGYTDPAGGIARYYIVAVDTLGQDGYPSNAVWGDQPPDHQFYSRYETWGAHGAEGGKPLPFDFGEGAN